VSGYICSLSILRSRARVYVPFIYFLYCDFGHTKVVCDSRMWKGAGHWLRIPCPAASGTEVILAIMRRRSVPALGCAKARERMPAARDWNSQVYVGLSSIQASASEDACMSRACNQHTRRSCSSFATMCVFHNHARPAARERAAISSIPPHPFNPLLSSIIFPPPYMFQRLNDPTGVSTRGGLADRIALGRTTAHPVSWCASPWSSHMSLQMAHNAPGTHTKNHMDAPRPTAANR
jgi:hypothetical protein